MSVLDQNLDIPLDQFADDNGGVYSHNTRDREIKKSIRNSNGNARKKIEEYHEALLLKKLTKGVFDE